MNSRTSATISARNSILASALRTLSVEAAGIVALEEALANGLGAPFTAAVALLMKAKGRVIVTGMGKSGHVGRKIAATLASTGTPAFFVHPGEASHGDLGMVTADDVILALSWSGETVELRDLVGFSRRFGVGLVAITSVGDSALGKAADVCLDLPRAEEACPNGLAPTTSTLMQLAIGDALAVALLEERGFTAADFRTFHPGGKLGAVLTQVRDVMHDGEALPLSRLGAPMTEVILEMTTKGFGCCGVVDQDGKLVGIVTDGDLRRHMQADLLALPVDEVMTPAPKTVRPDQFASEVIDLLNRTKITALFAVEAGKPIGILHVHDLLRAGVA
ncbi:KpsF/GutQ family sugar-phosphate isomerase [Phreatobacter stygius]|uniref:KpsF/GutQ family sugar-phosphate isomerase n=1 Tax=Phreatobacter stygius TaxID=1940610 RepID=A0A4D7B7Z4_9HYPH|nr:KpsF/GutQ family sugar-phosphate isomerase [Phreatobacter stygius]QCI64262.1 KpsF/GutQ family sugar-phosphate isomerase [Phreatobacter stygius]